MQKGAEKSLSCGLLLTTCAHLYGKFRYSCKIAPISAALNKIT